MVLYPFLDTKTTMQPDGSITVSVYRKPTNTDRYLDFNSHHHIQHKRAVARTLLNRASTIPSTNEEKISETQRVIKTLNTNGYPTPFINGCKSNTHHYRRPPGDKNTKRNFVVLPYNEGLSERISRLLGKHNIKVSHKPLRTVASFFKKPKDPQSKESERGAVYRIDCINYSAVYIGQISRALKTRKREHSRAIATPDRNSLLAKHTLQTGHNFDLDNITIIVDKCPQWNRRQFLEAWHSTKNKNAVNEHIEFPRIYYILLVLFNCFTLPSLVHSV